MERSGGTKKSAKLRKFESAKSWKLKNLEKKCDENWTSKTMLMREEAKK